MTRHCGLIGMREPLSTLAKFASASCRTAAFPSTGNGEKGGKATICSCHRAEYSLRSRRLIAATACSKVALRSSMSAITSPFLVGCLLQPDAHAEPITYRLLSLFFRARRSKQKVPAACGDGPWVAAVALPCALPPPLTPDSVEGILSPLGKSRAKKSSLPTSAAGLVSPKIDRVFTLPYDSYGRGAFP